MICLGLCIRYSVHKTMTLYKQILTKIEYMQNENPYHFKRRYIKSAECNCHNKMWILLSACNLQKEGVSVIIFSLRQAYSHLKSERNESENYKIAIITGYTVIYHPQHWDDFEWFAVPPAIIIYYFKYHSCLIYMYKHNPLHMYTTQIIKNCLLHKW